MMHLILVLKQLFMHSNIIKNGYIGIWLVISSHGMKKI